MLNSKEAEVLSAFSDLEVSAGAANAYHNSSLTKELIVKLKEVRAKLYKMLLEGEE